MRQLSELNRRFSRVVLASKSPRRRELLGSLGIDFEIIPSGSEEKITKTEPGGIVMELARSKAEDVFRTLTGEGHPDGCTSPDGRSGSGGSLCMAGEAPGKTDRDSDPDSLLVIGSDTIVVRDGQILGKPSSAEEARAMLESLSGRAHQVYTGVALLWQDGAQKASERVFYEKTDVYVSELENDEIEAYIATGDPFDKAGAYGIQSGFARFIGRIEGDYNTVVGLPVARLYQELKQLVQEGSFA